MAELDVKSEVEQIYQKIVDPLAEKFQFEKAPHASELHSEPLVLAVGNHSSGKSTFLNYLLGSEVQSTGVAPTDDCFTIIAYAQSRSELQGPTITTDETLSYRELERLGPDFVRHLRMKTLPAKILENLSLVDTPGMIDSASGKTRVYDFTKAVRWFAERADVILFFFDPDKPGTTGETLEVLKVALLDLEHKVHFVLNKVDRFERIEDFARTYGALCWNLSKVIVSKDLPNIDNLYIPREGLVPAPTELPLKSFDKIREKLVDQVKRAPELREENVITRLDDHAKRLYLHAQMCDVARREYSRRWWGLRMALGGGGLSVLLATYLAAGAESWTVPVAVFVIGALFLANFGYYAYRNVRGQTQGLLDGLDRLFKQRFRRELEEGNLDLRDRWKRIRTRTRQVLARLELSGVPRLRRDESKRINDAIEKRITRMRGRRAARGAGGRIAES